MKDEEAGMHSCPVIGITAEVDVSAGTYKLKRAYADALAASGAAPFVLPYAATARQVLRLCGKISGLLVSGGANDVPPEMYGEENKGNSRGVNEERSRFEAELFLAARRHRIPVLGICGGMQLMNVALGGSLIQDIRQEVAAALEHRQQAPADEPAHEVRLVEGAAVLRELCGRRRFAVNSTHHQAVKRPGRGVAVAAVAPDGIVEAIEAGGGAFCVGVQWHPERMWERCPVQRRILRGFVRACS